MLYRKAIGSRAEPELILDPGSYAGNPIDWTDDGRTLVFMQAHPSTQTDIWLLHTGDEPRAEPFLNGDADELSARLSPEDDWLAFESDAPGRFEIHLTPFPERGTTQQVSVGGGQWPIWSPSGDRLYYQNLDRTKLMSVSIATDPELVIGPEEEVFDTPNIEIYDIDPEGKRFLALRRPEREPITRLNVVFNWDQVVKELVPTGTD